MFNIPGVGKSDTARPIFGRAFFLGIVHLVSTTITHILDPVADSEGMYVTFKKTDSSATTVTIDGFGSETIDGQATIELVDQYEVVRLYCDGSAWYIV